MTNNSIKVTEDGKLDVKSLIDIKTAKEVLERQEKFLEIKNSDVGSIALYKALKNVIEQIESLGLNKS